MRLFLLLAFLSGPYYAEAAKPARAKQAPARQAPAAKPSAATRPVPVEPAHALAPRERYDGNKVWLAPPVALFAGFGLGHVMQERYGGYTIAYTAADALGFVLIFASMGSCPNGCSSGKKTMHAVGLGTLLVSRVAQVVDTTIWGVNYRNAHQGPKVSLLPLPTGMSMLFNFQF